MTKGRLLRLALGFMLGMWAAVAVFAALASPQAGNELGMIVMASLAAANAIFLATGRDS